MAITQDKKNREFITKMTYDMTTHRLVPTNDLLKKAGVDMDVEAYNNTLSEIERYNIADSVYDYMFAHMPPHNQEIVLALIAENANDEQVTIARAFGAFAQFTIRGGDEASHRSSINLETSMYVPPEVMENNGLGWQVKRILKNGNGKINAGLWFTGEMKYEVSDVTDLVFGSDY